MESCSVTMRAEAYPGSPSTKANNGLDARFSTTTSNTSPIYRSIPASPYQIQIGTGAGANSSGTAPRIVQGGDTVTVTCSPTGTCSTGNGPFSFTFDYSVNVYPATVDVGNTVRDSYGLFGEIGRSHSGSLWVFAPGVTPSDHWWTIDGDLFKSYAHSAAAPNGRGVVTPFLASDLHSDFPMWYWKRGGLKGVSCSARVSYRGIVFGVVSAKANVIVESPDWSFEADCSGRSTILSNGMISNGNPSFVTSSGERVGFKSSFWVSVCPHFRGGSAHNVQLVNANWACYPGIPAIWVTTNGESYLDTSYPYGATCLANNSHITAEDTDTPGYGGYSIGTWNVFTAFDTYLMYASGDPYENDVPLFVQYWNWNGDSTMTTVNSPTPGPGIKTTDHPVWNHVLKLR